MPGSGKATAASEPGSKFALNLSFKKIPGFVSVFIWTMLDIC